MINNQRGFTLIELAVAMTIFVLVIGSALGIFISVVRSQKKILDMQKLLDETSYMAEYMSRHIRMAKKDTTGECVQTSDGDPRPGYNYSNREYYNQYIIFLDYKEWCHQFGWWAETSGSRVRMGEWISEDGMVNSSFDIGEPPHSLLTSKNFTLTLYPTFSLLGEAETDNIQPRVTFSFHLQKEPLEGTTVNKPDIYIQTTISQRDLDI